MDIDGNPTGSGGVSYDQDLNTTDNVEFKSISTTKSCFTEGIAPLASAAGEVCLYAKTDKKLYYKDDTGAETALNGGGGMTGGGWLFDTTLSGAPASGKFRYDNAVSNLATLVNIHYTNDLGVDLSPLLKTLNAGDNVMFSNADSSNIKMYQVTLNIDQTTYAELKVEFERETNAANYILDEEITITVYTNGEGGANINSSTGVISGGVLSIGALNTQFNISDGSGQVLIDDPLNTGKLTLTNVTWSGLTDITVTDIATQLITFVSVDQNGSVLQESSRPSVEQRRHQIYLGVIVHVNLTSIDTFNNQQDYSVEPLAQWRDLTQALGFINIQGNNLSPATQVNPNELTIIKTEGKMFATGSNYSTNPNSPNWRNLPEINTATGGIFQYRMQNGNSGPINDTKIQPNIFDNGTNYPGITVSTNKFTIQRFYSFTSNNLKIQAGQTEFNSLAEAEDNLFTENYNVEPSIGANGMLIGYLIIKQGTTDLTNPANYKFFDAGKFGSIGGSSTTTSLQIAYNNSSSNPEILTDSTGGALNIRRGSALDTDDVLTIQNGAGTNTFTATGDGDISANSLTLTGTANAFDLVLKDSVNLAATASVDLSMTDSADAEISSLKYLNGALTLKNSYNPGNLTIQTTGAGGDIRFLTDNATLVMDDLNLSFFSDFAGYDLGKTTDRWGDAYLSSVIVGATGTDYTLPTARGTDKQILETDGSGNVIWHNKQTLSKSAFIFSPEATDDICLFFTRSAVTITAVSYKSTGGTSVTFNVSHSNGVDLWAVDKVSAVVYSIDTIFTDATCTANNAIRLQMSAVTGAVTSFEITIEYTED